MVKKKQNNTKQHHKKNDLPESLQHLGPLNMLHFPWGFPMGTLHTRYADTQRGLRNLAWRCKWRARYTLNTVLDKTRTDTQWLKRNVCRSYGCHISHLYDHFDTVFENTTPNMPPSSLRKEHVDEKGNLLNVKVIEWQERKWKNARNDMCLNNSKWNNTEWAKKKKKGTCLAAGQRSKLRSWNRPFQLPC